MNNLYAGTNKEHTLSMEACLIIVTPAVPFDPNAATSPSAGKVPSLFHPGPLAGFLMKAPQAPFMKADRATSCAFGGRLVGMKRVGSAVRIVLTGPPG